ncbi:Exonuclease Mut-7 [Manis pentadactyla]|nr:Exonuclease Mut-7 [Manis pentadactyla]
MMWTRGEDVKSAGVDTVRVKTVQARSPRVATPPPPLILGPRSERECRDLRSFDRFKTTLNSTAFGSETGLRYRRAAADNLQQPLSKMERQAVGKLAEGSSRASDGLNLPVLCGVITLEQHCVTIIDTANTVSQLIVKVWALPGAP